MQRLVVPVLTSAALIGGYGVARATGVRWLGGVVLGAGTAGAATLTARRSGGVPAGVVAAVTLLAFGGSHPLARRLGAWPSVLTVTAPAALAAAVLAAPRTA